jgi:hypothetical protein
MTDPIDRARAEAIHATTSTVRRAQALERDLDAVEAFLAAMPLGRLAAICSTLAEHEARLAKLEGQR